MKAGLPLDLSTSEKLESLDDSIYKMGATQWDEKRGIPVDWMNTNKAYETPTAIEQLSGSFFTGARIPGTLGTDLLSFKDPEKVLNKATVFTQKQWGDKEAAQEELQFINNYLLDPQMAAEYAKTAPFSFFKYWSEKGGTLGLKEHMQSLKVAARADDVDVETAKWGALTTVKGVKTKDFTFASLRGQVTELWDTTSPKISQVGLLKDSSGESIKFTVLKNQQQNIPKVEVGKNYYFGNVASQEWHGRLNLNVNQYSAIEEIKPMPFNTAPPLILPGSKVELRDYSKPYSIDPAKGMITYTTKSGKIAETPIQKTDLALLKKIGLGDEPGDLAAFLPFMGLPFLQSNVTGGTAQLGSQQPATHPIANMHVLNSLTGAYNNLGELGSIWWKKAQEANERISARGAAMPDAKGSPGQAWANSKQNRWRILPWDALDALGAALAPVSFIDQAAWGSYAGIGAMEGIRNEIQPSSIFGIEDPLEALVLDIVAQPTNLIGAGLTSKGKKLLSKMPLGFQVIFRGDMAKMGTREQVLETMRIRARPQNAEKPVEYFNELYGLQYEQVKQEYMVAEGVTKEEFESIAKTDPTFADKMATWIYTDYGKTPRTPMGEGWDFFNSEVRKAEQGTQVKVSGIDESFHYFDSSKIPPTKPIKVPLKPEPPAKPAGTYKATLAKARQAGIKNKIARTVGIAAAGSILFGLPDSEREYNKPQAREPLYPSNEKGFWGSLGDVATFDNYVEGAAMRNAVQSEKVYTPEDRITPSMALGIQNRDTSLFSIRGAAGTFLIDMPSCSDILHLTW